MKKVVIKGYTSSLSWYSPYVGKTFLVEELSENPVYPSFRYEVIKEYLPKEVEEDLKRRALRERSNFTNMHYFIESKDCEDEFIYLVKEANKDENKRNDS